MCVTSSEICQIECRVLCMRRGKNLSDLGTERSNSRTPDLSFADLVPTPPLFSCLPFLFGVHLS